jgi:hypothetical protein
MPQLQFMMEPVRSRERFNGTCSQSSRCLPFQFLASDAIMLSAESAAGKVRSLLRLLLDIK